MFNIIIFSLLISSIINFITKNKSYTILNCGIWAFLGKDNKYFNVDKFNILGMFNDARGGDASGVLSGNKITHSSDKYIDLVQKKLIQKPKKHPIVLGHSRKASSGGKDITFTQPFCYQKSNKIIGAAIHNGTIYNDEELAKKYNVPDKLIYTSGVTFSPNDTQILAYVLIELKDYSILKEYEGAAAIVWEDRIENKSYIFKGSSKRYQSAYMDVEERPLYTFKTKEGIWVSSLEEPLLVIADSTSPEIDEVEDNMILVVENGEITNKIPVDRTSSFQIKTAYSNWNQYNNYDEEMYHDAYYAGKNYPDKHNQRYKNYNKEKKKNDANQNFNKRDWNGGETILEVFKVEEISDDISYLENGRGRYWFSRELANGILHIDEFGYVSMNKEDGTKPYYFIDGIMILDHKKYTQALALYKQIEKGKYNPKGISGKASKEAKVVKTLCMFSTYPISNLDDSDRMTWHNSDSQSRLFSGNFNPVYTNKMYSFSGGKISSIGKLQSWNRPSHYDTACPFLDETKLEVGKYYKMKLDPEYLIRFTDVDKKTGINVKGEYIEIQNASNWIEIKESEWLLFVDEFKAVYPDAATPGRDDETEQDRKDWENDILVDRVSEGFDDVIKAIESIELEIMGNNHLESSADAQELVDEIKQRIVNSEFNT